MPDGDVVHIKMGSLFTTSYEAICENELTAEEKADLVAIDLKKVLKLFGNKPVSLLMGNANTLHASQGSVDPLERIHTLDDRARMLRGHRRGIAIALDVSKTLVLDAMDNISIQDWRYESAYRYTSRILRSEFIEHDPLVDVHKKVSPSEFRFRVNELMSLIEHHLKSFSKQIARQSSVQRLSVERLSDPEVNTYADFSSDALIKSLGE